MNSQRLVIHEVHIKKSTLDRVSKDIQKTRKRLRVTKREIKKVENLLHHHGLERERLLTKLGNLRSDVGSAEDSLRWFERTRGSIKILRQDVKAKRIGVLK